MQFLWLYIDDLMGKGLEISIILELLFYVSASLLPLALPLAILLSSLIVMGNLGESNELTALKSSGLSIYRILRPLTVIVFLLAVGTFYFANYIIPRANYKWHSIIWDIQEKKMASFLNPGSYTQEIEGLSIKIGTGKNNSFKDIIIHDRRERDVLKTIVADSGEFYRSTTGDFLFFKLYDGNVIEELKESPNYLKEDKKYTRKTYPSRKSDFRTATYKMDISGFQLKRSRDDLFKNDYEMLNVFQIDETVDSLQLKHNEMARTFAYNSMSKHQYFQAINYANDLISDSLKAFKESLDSTLSKSKIKTIIDKRRVLLQTTWADSNKITYRTAEMTAQDSSKAYKFLKSQLETRIKNLGIQIDMENAQFQSLRKYEIEFHRKFALSFSIILLFFIGAPLGAIVKRGGFGAPVVIAALLFMVYFILISLGEGMAKEEVISPFLGMWGPSFILAPFAIFLMIGAANDKSIGDIRFKFWKRKKQK